MFHVVVVIFRVKLHTLEWTGLDFPESHMIIIIIIIIIIGKFIRGADPITNKKTVQGAQSQTTKTTTMYLHKTTHLDKHSHQGAVPRLWSITPSVIGLMPPQTIDSQVVVFNVNYKFGILLSSDE